MKHTVRRAVLMSAAAAMTAGLAVAAAPAQAANPFPRPIKFGAIGGDNSFPAALATSLTAPTKNPSGANDWSCKPSKKHPYPVVLIHGTWENAYDNWNGLSPIIKHEGYCVFAPNFGNSTGIGFLNGTGDMVQSAGEVKAFVDKVLKSTGAAKVDLIGHSQGGAQARYVTNVLGLKSKVNQVIGLAPSNHPTTLSGITDFGKMIQLFTGAMTVLELVKMPAAVQQADQSPQPQAPFYRTLNDKGETVSGMKYTVIATTQDQVVTPYERAFITAGPGATVDNITIQKVCKQDKSEHVSLPYSKNVAQIVLNKLDPSDVRPIFCFAQEGITGNTQLVG